MTKERIILAFVAIITGLIITITLFTFYQQRKDQSLVSQTQPTITANDNKPTLVIDSPENESVTDKKTITLKGASLPKALIVIVSPTDDFIISADENGNFSKDIPLLADENLIAITAYTESGASETKELVVTQNSEEF